MIQPLVALAILEAMLLIPAADSAKPIKRRAKLMPSEQTCEYAINPLGVGAARPRFGWVLKSKERSQMAYSDIDLSSRFDCSNPVLNRIHQNVRWTLTNGLFGMPLDCLYSEHWAWTDPATITGSLYPRKHMPLFWTKWLEGVAHAQQPDGNVPTICPPTTRACA